MAMALNVTCTMAQASGAPGVALVLGPAYAALAAAGRVTVTGERAWCTDAWLNNFRGCKIVSLIPPNTGGYA